MEEMRKKIVKILRHSEKYTKTDMVYLARGGFWLSAGQAIASFAALGVSVAFANLVSTETFGTYKYILAIAGLFAIFSLPGMHTAITRAVSRGQEGVLHVVTKNRILFSLIGSAIALTCAGYYFYQGNTELSLAFLIISVSLPFYDTFTGYLDLLAGKRQFNLQTKYQALVQIVGAVSLITTLFFTANLFYILIAYLVPRIIVRNFLYWRIARSITISVDDDEQKETLAYGRHLTVMNIMSTIVMHTDKILLWKFLGPTQLAIYTFSISLPEQIKGPLKGISILALPKFATQTPRQISEMMPVLWYKLYLYAFALLSITIVYIFSAPYIFTLLFPQYMESVFYTQIFSLSLITTAGAVLTQLLAAQKKTKQLYAYYTANQLLTILMFFILIPTYGILGGVLAFVSSRFISVIGLVYMTKKTFQ